MINIEKEFVLSYIEEELSVLLDDISDVIIALDNLLLLNGLNNIQHTKDLKLRIDRLKNAIKPLIELNFPENLSENNLELCDLGSLLDKMLPSLKSYGQNKNVIVNSLIITPTRINGNSDQLRSVFKQLLYLLIKELENDGTIELSSQKENKKIIIIINIYGLLRFEIMFETILNLKELFSKKYMWKTQATKLFLISNTLKQNQSKITIRKISPTHRIISIILPIIGSENNLL